MVVVVMVVVREEGGYGLNWIKDVDMWVESGVRV